MAKYFDPQSERYVFQELPFERKRADKRVDVPFEKSVGGRKLSYLKEMFTEDDKLEIDVGQKNLNFLDKLLGKMADFSVCKHLERVHRARFMCHSCYHHRGNLKLAWKCAHVDKPHHSNGLCKKCFHQRYYRQRVQLQKH